MEKLNKIYDDDVISVSYIQDCNEQSFECRIAIKYKEPKGYKNAKGKFQNVTNAMGGETDWFILPHTFGIEIA